MCTVYITKKCLLVELFLRQNMWIFIEVGFAFKISTGEILGQGEVLLLMECQHNTRKLCEVMGSACRVVSQNVTKFKTWRPRRLSQSTPKTIKRIHQVHKIHLRRDAVTVMYSYALIMYSIAKYLQLAIIAAPALRSTCKAKIVPKSSVTKPRAYAKLRPVRRQMT